jgi:hypothetical protein
MRTVFARLTVNATPHILEEEHHPDHIDHSNGLRAPTLTHDHPHAPNPEFQTLLKISTSATHSTHGLLLTCDTF